MTQSLPLRVLKNHKKMMNEKIRAKLWDKMFDDGWLEIKKGRVIATDKMMRLVDKKSKQKKVRP